MCQYIWRRLFSVSLLAPLALPLAASPPVLPAPVASYTLTAELDAQQHRIDASGTVHWRNTTQSPAGELRFHLYLNAFRNSASTWLRHGPEEAVKTLSREGWGWTEIGRLETADGHDLLRDLEWISPDGTPNPEDATVARVPLPRPVEPGEEIELRLDFVSQLPRVVARTGFKNDFHLAAQWFPKLGVLEETPDGGIAWNAHSFHRSTEFFADYGTYDVTLVVPEGFVVGATGEQVESEALADGRERYRYVQEGVHDFAWTAWPHFVERRSTFHHPGLPEVEITLLLRPDTLHQEERYRQALEHALRLFGTWYGPYPYSTLTMVDPPWGASNAGGMEYPTFITTGTRIFNTLPMQSPEYVTVHEFGHQFWYGLVATNEFEESYLDEGINTYASYRVMREAYGPRAWSYELWGVPLVFPRVLLEHPLDTSARYFRAPATDPVARTSWGYLDRNAYRYLTYSKMSLLMEQLERTLGSETMSEAMRAYATRYRFHHPHTQDLIRTLSEVSGRDLREYFEQTLYSSEVLDMAVTEATTARRQAPIGVFGEGDERQTSETAQPLEGWQSTVVVQRLGGVRLPVTVELTFEGGKTLRREWDGQERWVRYRIEGPRLLHAEVDPDEVQVLDVNRLNNSRRTSPDTRASRHWAQRLRFWIQNLLETLGSFA